MLQDEANADPFASRAGSGYCRCGLPGGRTAGERPTRPGDGACPRAVDLAFSVPKRSARSTSGTVPWCLPRRTVWSHRWIERMLVSNQSSSNAVRYTSRCRDHQLPRDHRRHGVSGFPIVGRESSEALPGCSSRSSGRRAAESGHGGLGLGRRGRQIAEAQRSGRSGLVRGACRDRPPAGGLAVAESQR